MFPDKNSEKNKTEESVPAIDNFSHLAEEGRRQ